MFHDNTPPSKTVISCMITCRSVTYAQKYVKLLQQNGYPAYARRLPAHLSDTGCGHAVSVRPNHIRPALSLLDFYGMGPLRVFCETSGGLLEEMML